MNKERDSLLLGISICSSMVRDTNSALLGVTGFNEVHIKHFYCMIREPPLRGGNFSSTPVFEFCRAQTCPCHSPDNKLLNWQDQRAVLRLMAWDTKAKNKTDMMLCVYWGLLVQNIISFISNRHMWAIVSNNIFEDRQRRDIPFPI